ncbi:hypothetical protein [Streptomyces sp. NPDC096339]|uniref:hypothetical protein n=1 Tax=Streptomyces sp. NPDC096339 TaxID=3366086 RepID=UPI0037FF7906
MGIAIGGIVIAVGAARLTFRDEMAVTSRDCASPERPPPRPAAKENTEKATTA